METKCKESKKKGISPFAPTTNYPNATLSVMD